MFTVYLINIGVPMERTFQELADAIAYAKYVGFEARIDRCGVPVATVSPIGGVRHYTDCQHNA